MELLTAVGYLQKLFTDTRGSFHAALTFLHIITTNYDVLEFNRITQSRELFKGKENSALFSKCVMNRNLYECSLHFCLSLWINIFKEPVFAAYILMSVFFGLF